MIYVLIWLYTMYCGKTMNTLSPVMVTINKLWQKMNVSCFQDISILLTLQSSVTLIAVVRERRLTYYNFIILLMYFKYIFLNNKSLNQKTRLSCYGCYQCFAPISFVVAMLDDNIIVTPLPFCAHIFVYFLYTALLFK